MMGKLTLAIASLALGFTSAVGAVDQTGPSIGNSPIDNRQPSLAINYLIQTEGVYPSHGTPTDQSLNSHALGMVRSFAGSYPFGNSAAGQLLSIAQNTALFSLYGTSFGGDGRSSFGLPDLRGAAPRGANGVFNELGRKSGTTYTTLNAQQLYPHAHEIDQSVMPTTGITGISAPISNEQRTTGLNYIINMGGSFPSRSGNGPRAEGPFLGQVALFGGNFAPRGWAFADGSLVDLSTNNQDLYSLLGATYGGDGRTTFALPDLRDRVAIGAGSGPGLTPRRLGEKVGTVENVLQPGQLPEHDHPIADERATPGETGEANPDPISNMQPSLALNYLISLGGIYPFDRVPEVDSYGEITLFAGNFEPEGWAFADGRILPINHNEALFSLLGTMYGGDGRTTFALPDLRGRVAVGSTFNLIDGIRYRQGYAFGAEEIVLSEANLAAHTHSLPASVPLPASLPLLIGACGFLAARRRLEFVA